MFPNSWHWCVQTKSEDERMLEVEISTKRDLTPNHWWSNNSTSSEPAACHPAIHAGIPGGVKNSPWHMPAKTLKHPSMAAQTLPEKSHFCNLPCPQCCWHWSSAAVKKRRRVEHTCVLPCWVRGLNLLTEGLVKPQGQDEVWGGSWQLQEMKCRRQEYDQEDEPIPTPDQITFRHFSHPPRIRSWAVLWHRDKEQDQWALPARGL